mmetsp:Transcript_120634/g.210051  ORF Transcript_120634/g.210051 Transcript_120634/m.210051 type:complete len:98 (-) Transcript_120634:747-1040(-)
MGSTDVCKQLELNRKGGVHPASLLVMLADSLAAHRSQAGEWQGRPGNTAINTTTAATINATVTVTTWQSEPPPPPPQPPPPQQRQPKLLPQAQQQSQ